jgi:hypothetical protein
MILRATVGRMQAPVYVPYKLTHRLQRSTNVNTVQLDIVPTGHGLKSLQLCWPGNKAMAVRCRHVKVSRNVRFEVPTKVKVSMLVF